MKAYAIIKTSFKNQSIERICENLQQNLLYFSKNYDTIVKKTEEFETEINKFFKETQPHYNKYLSSANQNNTPDTHYARYFCSDNLCIILSVSEIDIPSLSETPLEIGDYVEAVPEAIDNIAGRTNLSKNNFPPLFRIVQADEQNVKVMVLCGSQNVRNTTSRMSDSYVFPRDYFRRIIRL